MTLITAKLALGDLNDPARFAHHIDAVLCCAREIPLFPGKAGYHFKLEDGAPIDADALTGAYAFLDEQLAAGHTVLVYCGHGTSRSPTVLSCYLALKHATVPLKILDHSAPSTGGYAGYWFFPVNRMLCSRDVPRKKLINSKQTDGAAS